MTNISTEDAFIKKFHEETEKMIEEAGGYDEVYKFNLEFDAAMAWEAYERDDDLYPEQLEAIKAYEDYVYCR